MAKPGQPERNRVARSFGQLRRFHHAINSDKVLGTHRGYRRRRRRANLLLHVRDNAGVGIRAAHDDELVGNSRGPVLEQNKDGAKENDGGKANYDLLAIPIKQGSVSIARHKVYADRVFRANKKAARRRSLCS